MSITQDNTDAVFSQLEAEQDAFLGKLLEAGNGYIRDETPVRTGNLRDHNAYEVTGPGEGRWFNDTEYAVPVELGHTMRGGRHVPANAFMQRGVDRLSEEADGLAREHFGA